MDQNIILTLILIVGTLFILSMSRYFLKKIGKLKRVTQKRVQYISISLNILIIIMAMLLLTIIWSVSLSGILVFASSIFAVIGVALFAQWSILSNLTASIIIFFSYPTRVGDTIKIVDGDNSITGVITEISLFQIKILDNDGDTVLYPNNLFMQKPIVKIKRNKAKLKNQDYSI